MTKEELIAKIQKLKALSESSNPNEAAAALSRIQKLMQTYNLEQTDIDENNISEIELKAVRGLQDVFFAGAVCQILKKSFGVHALMRMKNARTVCEIVVIGPKAMLQSCEYVYVMLTRYVLNAKKVFDMTVWYEIFCDIITDKESKILSYIKSSCPSFYSTCIKKRLLPLIESQGMIKNFYSTEDEDRFSEHLLKSKQLIGCAFKDALNCGEDGRYLTELKGYLQKQAAKNRKYFTEGYLQAIALKIEEYALTDTENEDIDSYIKHKYPQTKSRHSRTRGVLRSQIQAYNSGRAEGRKAKFSQAVENHTPEKKRLFR